MNQRYTVIHNLTKLNMNNNPRRICAQRGGLAYARLNMKNERLPYQLNVVASYVNLC